MNIFYKRPLALILCIGICGFFLFTIENPIIRCFLILTGIFALIISLLIALLLSHLYFDTWFKAYEKHTDEIEVVGVVEEKAPSSSYSIRLRIRCEKINDKTSVGYNL